MINKRKVEPIKCTKEKYEEILKCITVVTLIALINLDYLWLIYVNEVGNIPIILFVINGFILATCKRYIGNRIEDTKIKKSYKKSLFNGNLSNIICCLLYMLQIEYTIRNIFVFLWVVYSLVYVIVFCVVRLVDIANGMEKFLKEN